MKLLQTVLLSSFLVVGANAFADQCCELNMDSYDPTACQNRTVSDCWCCNTDGEWLPEDPVLFRPLLADPRQITYSAGWRWNDQVFVKNVIPVSFGDTIAFYRWFDIGPWCGDLQIELEGALWAIFDPLHDSSPLINADYYVGIPITYAFDDWEFRLRAYHISSHIGDEYLLNHPNFNRVNPSAEYVDFFISNDLTEDIRLYAGLGVIVQQDPSFKTGRFYTATGFELRMKELGWYSACNRVYGEPFMAVYIRTLSNFKHHIDQTWVLGYEFGKTSGQQRVLRVFLQYHDGYSLEGQFAKTPTNYLSLIMSYGF